MTAKNLVNGKYLTEKLIYKATEKSENEFKSYVGSTGSSLKIVTQKKRSFKH